jgi:putative endonuclease
VFYFVYILASTRHGALYVGVTNDLIRRVFEHRCGAVPGFSKKHHIHQLVYFEAHTDISEAILREKGIKRWLRAWKVELIERENPQWRDLWPEIAAEQLSADGSRLTASLRPG